MRYPLFSATAYVRPLATSFAARPVAIAVHAGRGSIALLAGVWQHAPRVRTRWLAAHRLVERLYAACVFASGVAGLYLAQYAHGGLRPRAAFILLALALLGSTAAGAANARRGAIDRHQCWMQRSFALLCSAVTLRLRLPLLIATFGAFRPAYQVVTWLSWVPNLMWAEWWRWRARQGANAARNSCTQQGARPGTVARAMPA